MYVQSIVFHKDFHKDIDIYIYIYLKIYVTFKTKYIIDIYTEIYIHTHTRYVSMNAIYYRCTFTFCFVESTN